MSENLRNEQKKEYLLKHFDNGLYNKIIEANIVCYIIGGAITSTFTSMPINDYDLYCEKKEEVKKLEDIFSQFDKCIKLTETANAITYKYNNQIYQVIKAFVGHPVDIMNQFDFTICMGSYGIHSGYFILHDTFLLHLADKSLIFNTAAQYPVCSLYRVHKYLKRGYQLPPAQLLKIILKINTLNLLNPSVLKEQLEGVDTLLLKPLTDQYLQDNTQDQININDFLDFVEKHLDRIGYGYTNDEANNE